MTAVLFQRQGGTSCTVRFRYDAEVVELIKTSVPSYARSWNPTAKEWTVEEYHAGRLAAALRATGHQVVGLSPTPPPPRTDTRTPDTAQWAYTLLTRVGPTRRDSVFRALTRVLHPDNPATGDHQLQLELNHAFTVNGRSA